MIPRSYTIPTPYIVGPVHCYSVELDGELTLFDCGPPTAACRRFLESHIDLPSLKNLIITHGHIDHWGQLQWLAEQGVRVFLPRADYLKIVHWEERRAALGRLAEEVGFPPGWRRRLDAAWVEDSIYRRLPPGCQIVEESLPARFGITVHPCAGHSVSDLVYEGDGWIVSGDTLLDGIFPSPVLDVVPEGTARFDNYTAWCESLVRLAALDGCTVLPGHRDGGRVQDLLLGWPTWSCCRCSTGSLRGGSAGQFISTSRLQRWSFCARSLLNPNGCAMR